jgi:hypothetical protein
MGIARGRLGDITKQDMSVVATPKMGQLGGQGAYAQPAALAALVLLVSPTGARASLTPIVPANPSNPALQVAQRTVSRALAQAGTPAAIAPALAQAATAARSSAGASIAVAPAAPAPAPRAQTSRSPQRSASAGGRQASVRCCPGELLVRRVSTPPPVIRPVPPTKPARSPIDTPRAAPGGHADSIAASGPTNVSVSLFERRLESQIASTSWDPTSARDQPPAQTPLGPELPSLLAALDSLGRGGQSLSALAVASQPPAAWMPPAALPAPAPRDAAPGRQRSTIEKLVVPLPHRPLAPVPTALAPISSVALIQDLRRLAPDAIGQRLGGARRARQHSAAVGSSAAVAQAAPDLTSLPAGGVAGTASAGVGVGAAALALLALAAASLLPPLLPGRLALELSPWQSTLLSWRLERPG